MAITKTLGVFFLLPALVLTGGVRSVAAHDDDRPNYKCGERLIPDVATWEKGRVAYDKIEKWSTMDDQTLRERIRTKNFDAEMVLDVIPVGVNGEIKNSDLQIARRRISDWVHQQAREVVKDIGGASTISEAAGQQWLECIRLTFPPPQPKNELSITLEGKPCDQNVKATVQFVRPVKWAGEQPNVIAVEGGGFKNMEQVRAQLLDKPISQNPVVLERLDPKKDGGWITVYTKEWGGVCISVPGCPVFDADAIWHAQLDDWAKKGEFAFASRSFPKYIIFQWNRERFLEAGNYRKATKLVVNWSTEREFGPGELTGRHEWELEGWRRFVLDRRSWAHGSPALPFPAADTPIYFWLEFIYPDPNNPDRNSRGRLHEGRIEGRMLPVP